jgi:SAM-dependent methyltransferase
VSTPAPEIAADDLTVAPCLGTDPLGAPGGRLVRVARQLGSSMWADTLRAWCVPQVFQGFEAVAASGEDPVPEVVRLLDAIAAALEASAAIGFAPDEQARSPVRVPTAEPSTANTVTTVTGDHYGQLFRAFDASSFWDEPRRILGTRLERNGIDEGRWTGRSVLDAGCGGGRYTVAWRRLGAANAVGVDVSTTGVADANARVTSSDVDGVRFVQGSVLELPLAAGSFDVVFSNGVLHHTTDWEAGVHELVRVLRSGGLGWLYLIEAPGGLFWDLIEILRVVLRDVDRATARQALALIGMPTNRIFYMLDHVMVPINLRLPAATIVSALEQAGAVDIRRLDRGTDFDRVESVTTKRPFADVLYGAGEHRFVFST